MRFVHYYPAALGDSGVSMALWSWAEALSRAGREVMVLHADRRPAGDPGLKFVEAAWSGRIPARHVPHQGSGRLTLRPEGLERALGRDDLLVLHEGWVTANHVAAAAADRAGVPYIVMPHGVYEPAWRRYLRPPRRLRERLERRLLEEALAVHIFFASEAPDISALAPAARFLCVPTGMDMPRERWTGGGGYVSWLGRYDPKHKGLDLLLEAMDRLPVALRPHLVLHGYDYRGGYGRLRSRIASLGLGPWVDARGPIAGEAKTQFLERADAYVHPSRWECHSIALLENLALGAPCLVSSSIHVSSDLAEDRAAVLATPDPDALAAGLLEVLDCGATLGAAGRATVGRRFAWDRLVPAYLAALDALGIA